MRKIRILDDVALTVDKSQDDLRAGCVGQVIEVGWDNVLEKPEYAVEFVGKKTGKLFAILWITDTAEIVPLCFDPEAQD